MDVLPFQSLSFQKNDNFSLHSFSNFSIMHVNWLETSENGQDKNRREKETQKEKTNQQQLIWCEERESVS